MAPAPGFCTFTNKTDEVKNTNIIVTIIKKICEIFTVQLKMIENMISIYTSKKNYQTIFYPTNLSFHLSNALSSLSTFNSRVIG
jgi:hypothetical protein